MRTFVVLGMTLLVTVALSSEAPLAAAAGDGGLPAEEPGLVEAPHPPGEAQRALDEANAAISAVPARRDEGRAALLRAIAAGGDRGVVSEAYFRLASLDEDEEEFERALVHYQEAAKLAVGIPGARWMRNSSMRIQWLNAHGEGKFAPLKRLHRLKRDPVASQSPEAIEAFARDVEAFPPGWVRAESRVLVATAWLGPLHRVKDAIEEFRKVLTDPSADGMDVHFAKRGLVDGLLADGQLEEAARVAEANALQIEPEVMMRLRRLVRRRAMVREAEIATAVFAGIAAAALVYARLRGGVGALWARTPTRVAAALLCAATVVAAAFAVTGALAPVYLERVGL